MAITILVLTHSAHMLPARQNGAIILSNQPAYELPPDSWYILLADISVPAGTCWLRCSSWYILLADRYVPAGTSYKLADLFQLAGFKLPTTFFNICAKWLKYCGDVSEQMNSDLVTSSAEVLARG